MTAGVAAEFTEAELLPVLAKYVACDWGVTHPADWGQNDQAVALANDRIVAKYVVREHELFVITEADRSYTTILFPAEY